MLLVGEKIVVTIHPILQQIKKLRPLGRKTAMLLQQNKVMARRQQRRGMHAYHRSHSPRWMASSSRPSHLSTGQWCRLTWVVVTQSCKQQGLLIGYCDSLTPFLSSLHGMLSSLVRSVGSQQALQRMWLHVVTPVLSFSVSHVAEYRGDRSTFVAWWSHRPSLEQTLLSE